MAEVEVKFLVTGKRPLMMHNPAAMQVANTGSASKKTNIPTPEEEAEKSAYRMASGNLFVKAEMFIGAMRSAASGLKIGKFAAKPIIAAGIQLPDEQIPLINPKTKKPIKDYTIDTRRAVLQSGMQKVAVMRSRARVDEWACVLRVIYDDEILAMKDPVGLILGILQESGKRVGICDQRPGAPRTPGPFGTYAAALAA